MAELPPKDTWVATGASVIRWSPKVDMIQVLRTLDGKVLQVQVSGVSVEVVLGQAEADHLGDLLKRRP